MAYWLVKSEPSVYSWQQLVKDGKTTWDGVRNYAARNHLKAMKKGDLVLYYHSNEGVEIVGIAEILREHYPDPTTDEEAWVTVDIKPVKALNTPVSLKQIKQHPRFSNMALIKIGRLSVQPVKEEEWKGIMELAGEGKKEKQK